MEQVGREKKFLKANQVLFLSAQPASIILVEKGLLKVYALHAGGQERILFLLGPGDYCSELEQVEENQTMYIQAKTDSVLELFPASVVQRSLEKEGLQDLFQSMSRQIQFLSREIREHTFFCFQTRLASKLYYYYGQLNVNGQPLHFTHQELADLLGVSRITVTRALHTLEQAGLIKKGRKKLYITDPVGLQEVARGGESN